MPTAVAAARPDASAAPESVPHCPVAVLIGPPNSGKTTLFNRLTGLRQKVANYPGVTVEKHIGRARLASGRELDVIDLPGVHGFASHSPDAKITYDVLDGRIGGLPLPEAIIVIVDATRLNTHLMLLEPVLQRTIPTLLVLNMVDAFEAGGGQLDDDALAAKFGVEVVRTNARAGRGIRAVAEYLDRQAGQDADPSAQKPKGPRPRPPLPTVDALTRRQEKLRRTLAAARYRTAGPSRMTRRLDALFLHRFLGPAIFVGIAALVFQAIFTWAAPVMDAIEAVIASSGEWTAARMPSGWFRDMLTEGVWNGVGAVLVFLPQILILTLFLGILEGSGYMARAAVIADRMMMRVGLPGRALLPLLSAYACAIPAILSARTIADERDRLAAMFVAPFMTCSARLPVYALLIAAFIPERPLLGPFLGTQAATLLGLYLLGIAAATGTTFLIKRTLLRGPTSGFVLELPPYRVPLLRTLLLRLADRSRIFVRRVGKVILTVTIVLWTLAQFPRVDGATPPVEESALGRIGQVIEPVIEPLGFDWKIGVGLVSSLAAREVIVGTLGTIYGIDNSDESSVELRAALRRDLDYGSAVGLLIFFVFALQCMSTVAMMRRETAGWKWPAIQFGYMLALGYFGALAANQLL